MDKSISEPNVPDPDTVAAAREALAKALDIEDDGSDDAAFISALEALKRPRHFATSRNRRYQEEFCNAFRLLLILRQDAEDG